MKCFLEEGMKSRLSFHPLDFNSTVKRKRSKINYRDFFFFSKKPHLEELVKSKLANSSLEPQHTAMLLFLAVFA